MKLAFIGPTTMTQVVNLTSSDPRCTGSPLTCTIALTLLAGSYTVSIDTYDKAPAGGNIPAGANLLSTAKNAPFTMAGGITNTIGVTLDGVPASLLVSGLPNATVGVILAATAFDVTAKDADGNIITGTYLNPIALSTSDSSGATTIATSGSDRPPDGKLLSSSDVARLAYTGASIAPVAISAGVLGASVAHGVFAALPAITSLSATAGAIGAGPSETLTGNFVAGATTLNVSGTGITVTHVVATATTLTAQFFIDLAAPTGVRTISVTSIGGTSATQNFTIFNTGVLIVTSSGDSGAGTLRNAMTAAAAGDTIVFDTTQMCAGAIPCTIVLASALPPIAQSQTIDGGQFWPRRHRRCKRVPRLLGRQRNDCAREPADPERESPGR